MATGSFPSKSDVTAVLRELGASVKDLLLPGPCLKRPPFVVGEGEPVTYRLTVNGGSVDEAEMRIVFSQPTYLI